MHWLWLVPAWHLKTKFNELIHLFKHLRDYFCKDWKERQKSIFTACKTMFETNLLYFFQAYSFLLPTVAEFCAGLLSLLSSALGSASEVWQTRPEFWTSRLSTTARPATSPSAHLSTEGRSSVNIAKLKNNQLGYN